VSGRAWGLSKRCASPLIRPKLTVLDRLGKRCAASLIRPKLTGVDREWDRSRGALVP